MRCENVQAQLCLEDPRDVLVKTKYFKLRPEPLEDYLLGLKLSQACERVFWLHWDLGFRNGNYTSEISLSEVARRVRCDISSVTRAYQRLRQLGLIRRQDPGRDPAMPFSQAIAVTEVRLPREALAELLAAPNRKPVRTIEAHEETPVNAALPCPIEQPSPAESAPAAHAMVTAVPAALVIVTEAPQAEMPAAVAAAPQTETLPCAATPAAVSAPAVDVQALWGRCLETLKESVPERDFATWVRPIQAHERDNTLVLFAPNQFALEWIAQHVQARIEAFVGAEAPGLQLVLRVGVRPASTTETTAVPTTRLQPQARLPRQLNTFSLARLRKQLTELNVGKALDERLREIVWSVEKGALAKYEVKHAINIALKLVRTGAWTRPSRMPPNWRRAVA